MRRRILSIITALALLWSLCPIGAFAAGDAPDADTGLCPHHPEHTEDCGYLDGTGCTYVCDECKAPSDNDSENPNNNDGESITLLSNDNDTQDNLITPQSNDLVATVTIDGTPTDYSIDGTYTDAAAAFTAAWDSAQGITATIDLLQNVSPSTMLEVSDNDSDITLNISNNVVLSGSSSDSVIKIAAGSFSLNGGTVRADTDGADALSLQSGSGTAEINDCTIIGSRSGISIIPSSNITLKNCIIQGVNCGVAVSSGSAKVEIEDCDIRVMATADTTIWRVCGVQSIGGTTTIKGNTKITVNATARSGNGANCSGIYVNAQGAVNIESGEVSIKSGEMFCSALEVSGGNGVKISGGIFSAETTSTEQFAQARAIYSQSGGAIKLLADGCAYYDEENYQLSTSDNKELVKVGKKFVNIIKQPQYTAVTYGYIPENVQHLSIKTEAVNGSTLAYQWYQEVNGILEEVPGATSADSPLPSGLTVDGNKPYNFYCIISCNGYFFKSNKQTVYVQKKKITPTVTLEGYSFPYTGEQIKPSVITVKDETGNTIPESEYSVSWTGGSNLGENQVFVSDKIAGNYSFSVYVPYTITKGKKELIITNVPETFTYGDSFVLSSKFGNSAAELTTWAATKGSGLVTIEPIQSGNVTDAKVTLKGTGEVTIREEMPESGLYESAAAELTFTIQPKQLTVTGITAENRAYDGTNVVRISNVTLNGSIIEGDQVSVDTSNLTGTTSSAEPGDYTVSLSTLPLIGEGAANYTLTRPAGGYNCNVTISKASATPKTGDLAVANKQAYTYTYGLGALRPDLPGGMNFGSTPVTYELGTISLGGYYTGGAEIEGQTLTLPIEAADSETVGSVGTVTVIIHTGNFEDMTATINVRSVNKIIPEGAPALSTDTLAYGQPLSTITLSGSMTDGGTAVPGTFAWSSPENRPAVQEGYAAAWVFTPDDNDTYAIVNGTSAIDVVPASLTGAEVTLSETAFRYDGASHSPSVSSVTLNGVTLTAGTDYTADIPTGTDAGTYTVTITGEGNYTGTATVTFTINPVVTEEIDQKDGSGRDLRLEVETGLSSVPDALAGNPRFDTPEKIETELRTRVQEVMANVGGNIAVYDVTLQYKDENGVWHEVHPDDFPAGGVTATLPYPAGTGMSGYTFTVQHLISSGANAGTIETMPYRLTADGLECTFSSLSPVAIGYQTTAQPEPEPEPEPEQPDDNESTRPNRKKRPVASAPEDDTERPVVTDDHAQNCPASRFPDLNVADWYHEAIDFVLARGLMSGTNAGFAPNAPLSRAMLAQILWNHAGKPTAAARSTFPDVSASEWYTGAIDWASENGIVSGYSDGRFGPNDSVTREQLAAILWRYAGSPAASAALSFTDAGKVSGYALDAMRWAVEKGIISGSGGQLSPQSPATRAQAAQMLMNLLKDG